MALIWELFVGPGLFTVLIPHVSKWQGVAFVEWYCSFQFISRPFLPFGVQVVVHTGTATAMFPLLTFLGPYLSRTMSDAKWHLSSCGTLPPSCHHSTLISSSPPWYSSLLVPFSFPRSPFHLSQIPTSLSLHIYRSSLAFPDALSRY
jgi:hypothetical protein